MPFTRKISSNARSIGEILHQSLSYKVPFYQRDFTWTPEQVGAFWQGIAQAIKDEHAECFLGAIVVGCDEDKNSRSIVDGQQRLALITMVFAAIARSWQELEQDKRAQTLIENYIGGTDEQTGKVVSKLSLNRSNDPIFKALTLKNEVVSNKKKKKWPKSNQLIADAFDQITNDVQTWLEAHEDKAAALTALEQFVTHRMKMVVIEAREGTDAFVIFETLHERKPQAAPPPAPELVKA